MRLGEERGEPFFKKILPPLLKPHPSQDFRNGDGDYLTTRRHGQAFLKKPDALQKAADAVSTTARRENTEGFWGKSFPQNRIKGR